MLSDMMKTFGTFSRRMQKDHLGAYAATCAYFLMISFVPFIMIFYAFAVRTHADTTALTTNLISIVPSGLKAYVESILDEVETKSYAYVPLSVLLLIWSAAKVFHALTNGLNVISRVQETRGWFYLRFRSMFFVVLLFVFEGFAFLISMFGSNMVDAIIGVFPVFGDIVRFFSSFGTLFGYFALILLFLFIYKFLPNCRYTFRSQLPGALIVSTVWVFFSYLMSIYYEHNRNFAQTYGSMTSMILAMIWIYFCCYFLMFGAELNRVIYEDPEDNIIVKTVDAVNAASEKKHQEIEEELDEHSIWRPIHEGDVPINDISPVRGDGSVRRAASPVFEKASFGAETHASGDTASGAEAAVQKDSDSGAEAAVQKDSASGAEAAVQKGSDPGAEAPVSGGAASGAGAVVQKDSGQQERMDDFDDEDDPDEMFYYDFIHRKSGNRAHES